jgi:hypothetical protein
MIIFDSYWIQIIPSDSKEFEEKAKPIGGKWLIFGSKEELHLYIKLLDVLIEEGKFIAAAISSKIPKKDPFPHKDCVIVIFTSDDEEEIEKTKWRLKQIGLNPSEWKSDEETTRDWLPGGKLRLELEIIEKKRKIELSGSPRFDKAMGEISTEQKGTVAKTASIKPDTYHPPASGPVPPFQLDWIEPRLVDADRRSFFMSPHLHEVVKVMLSREPGGGKIVRGAISDKTVAQLYSGREIDDPEEARKIAMNFRANLRKTFRKYGLNDPHALIRRAKAFGGYAMGKHWHPKKPLINQAEVKLFFREDVDSDPGNWNRD